MIKVVRRQCITLIELLVAMLLLSLLITMLLSFYSDIHIIDSLLEKNRVQAFEVRYAQTRLWTIFSTAVPIKDKTTFFFTEEENSPFAKGKSLTFTYDNGAVFESSFSTLVLGKIYLDTQGRLCIATWPLPHKGAPFPPPMKKEVLMEQMEKLDFEFFIPVDKMKEKIKPDIDRPSTWLADYKAIPVSVHIKVTKIASETPIVFSIPLPNTQTQITYQE